MTGRQEYDRTKDRQRTLGKYMIDKKMEYPGKVLKSLSSILPMIPQRTFPLWTPIRMSTAIPVASRTPLPKNIIL